MPNLLKLVSVVPLQSLQLQGFLLLAVEELCAVVQVDLDLLMEVASVLRRHVAH